MFRAAPLRYGNAAGGVAIDQPSTKVERAVRLYNPASGDAPVPQADEKFFEPANHGSRVRGAATKTVTIGPEEPAGRLRRSSLSKPRGTAFRLSAERCSEARLPES